MIKVDTKSCFFHLLISFLFTSFGEQMKSLKEILSIEPRKYDENRFTIYPISAFPFEIGYLLMVNKWHSREKLKNVLVRKPGRKSYYFSQFLAKISSSRISYYFQLLKLVVVEFPTIFSF